MTWWLERPCFEFKRVDYFRLSIVLSPFINHILIWKVVSLDQVHRSEMIRKFMHLERSEYWEASDADWLYSAIYDVDVITNKACFGDPSDSSIMIFWTFCMFLCFCVLKIRRRFLLAFMAFVVSCKTPRYFGVFVMAQSCFALLLSVLLVGGLAAWSYVEEVEVKKLMKQRDERKTRQKQRYNVLTNMRQ